MKTAKERFESMIHKSSGCWLWQGAILINGYGLFRMGRRTDPQVSSHRAAWLIYHGPIPAGKQVLHHCDVRQCVNPNHLYIGTHADNMQDMVKRGRAAVGLRHGSHTHPESKPRGDRHPTRLKPELVMRGSKNGNAKLTEAQALEIRDRASHGQTQRLIASMLGVSQRTVWRVLNNQGWNHTS